MAGGTCEAGGCDWEKISSERKKREERRGWKWKEEKKIVGFGMEGEGEGEGPCKASGGGRGKIDLIVGVTST